jgi:hypothetical protein
LSASDDLDRAVDVLQLQHELIQSQQLEIVTLRTELAQARMIRAAVDEQGLKMDHLVKCLGLLM